MQAPLLVLVAAVVVLSGCVTPAKPSPVEMEPFSADLILTASSNAAYSVTCAQVMPSGASTTSSWSVGEATSIEWRKRADNTSESYIEQVREYDDARVFPSVASLSCLAQADRDTCIDLRIEQHDDSFGMNRTRVWALDSSCGPYAAVHIAATARQF